MDAPRDRSDADRARAPAAAPAPGFFSELVRSGTVRSQAELRHVYTGIVKRYHPDLAQDGVVATLDFDRLKAEFAEARRLLQSRQAAAAPVAPPEKGRFDRATFLAEFRDLVARGFPVNARAASKNKSYRRSIEYIDASFAALFDRRDAFAVVNEQLRNLRDGIPRVYWYAMQILWNSFDGQLSGLEYSRIIARRHYDCIVATLDKLGYAELKRLFLTLLEPPPEGSKAT